MRPGSSIFVALVVLAPTVALAQSARRPPERPAPAEHRPIYLRTETGQVINPATGQNATMPYSPAQTCGSSKCHDYAVIVSGYHFQQGAEKISDRFDPKRPWALSPGMFGGYRAGALRQLAKKKNKHPDEIDMTVWEWTVEASEGEAACASCHPGGGPMETDRDGKRYDVTLATNPGLANSLDGDYRGSHWDKSGVLEADCLMCHLPAYDWFTRNNQIHSWNLRWTATAASGLGLVDGAVYDPAQRKLTGKVPTVKYNRRLFNEDGKVVLRFKTHPADRNCVQCHGEPDMHKRGMSWNDAANPDIHNQQNLHCVDCHSSGLDHNFAKGRSLVETVRDDLDNSMANCDTCHTQGQRGATLATHFQLPPSHLRNIGCKTCHIPALHRAAGKYFDTTKGDVHWDYVEKASKIGQKNTWFPAYEKVDGKLQPVNPVYGIWWGNRDAAGVIHPLFAREIKAAWELYKTQVTDDNGDGEPEVNRPEEITAGLRAVQMTLGGNQRFRKVAPVYVKGTNVYELGTDGKLKHDPRGASLGPGFSISHNVAPARQALGAGGCSDCHARDSKLFARTYLVDPYDASGKEVREPVYHTLGLTDGSFTVFSIYWSLGRPWMGVLLLLIFFIATLHFTRFGPHEISAGMPIGQRGDDLERIPRFSTFDRILHVTVLTTFFFLAFTGLMFSFDGWRWLQLVFGSVVTPRVWHGWLGYLFGVGVLVMTVRWWRDAVLVRSDKTWFREFGGYLGSHATIPSERFNAGQKMYFWTVVFGGTLLLLSGIVLYFPEKFSINFLFIAALVHNVAAIFGVAGVLSHIYLSTLANPGTGQAIFAGWVTKRWARLHHPLWYRKVTGKDAYDPKPTEGEAHEAKEAPPDEPPAPKQGS